MSMQRWDPFTEMLSLREAMSRLMEESVVRPSETSPTTGGQQLGLAVDVREQEDSYVLDAALPGVKPEAIEITVLGTQVSIQGEITQEQVRKDERYHLRERRFGRFQRAISLPSNVQADQARAEFQDGVLTLTLPKAETARPRRIQVQEGSQPRNEGTDQPAGGDTEAPTP